MTHTQEKNRSIETVLDMIYDLTRRWGCQNNTTTMVLEENGNIMRIEMENIKK